MPWVKVTRVRRPILIFQKAVNLLGHSDGQSLGENIVDCSVELILREQMINLGITLKTTKDILELLSLGILGFELSVGEGIEVVTSLSVEYVLNWHLLGVVYIVFFSHIYIFIVFCCL